MLDYTARDRNLALPTDQRAGAGILNPTGPEFAVVAEPRRGAGRVVGHRPQSPGLVGPVRVSPHLV